ncbi:hypothetical protein [Phocaeicola vulgatus]|uniref:hypothetical protein n=1 Tax=Phocaeicola vulgatus TaxID=821 RepID=UPI002078BCF8|nr:hypothetical protein [Phocaeicola vulgatus]
MKDSRTITGDLMEEGVFVWCVFMPDGKASLHMNSEQHPDSRTHSRGRLLSPDVSVLHEILTPDDADRFLSLPEYGISIRIRIRLRYPGTEDRVVKQSEYEPEICFPVWIVPQEDGQVSLYLEEPSINQCAIQDITGLPGVPDLQPDGVPVRGEMLIRQAHWIFDLVDPALLKTGSCSGRLKPCLQEHPTLKNEVPVNYYKRTREVTITNDN